MENMNSYNGRRINNNAYFEPIYDPSLKGNLTPKDFGIGKWDFSQQKGPCRFIFKGEDLAKEGDYKRFYKISFLECDFIEISGKATTFRDCSFTKCDFRGDFKNVKFSQCTFHTSSLSLVKFYNCQFRDCKFYNIGVSGNETQLINSDITNPGEFLKAASTNLDHLPREKQRSTRSLDLSKLKQHFLE